MMSDDTHTLTTAHLLATAWEFKWSVNIGCAALIAAYYWQVRAALWRQLCFLLGIVVLFLSLESPLDPLGDEYLFSAHMAQHLLLILLVSPLLVLGISELTTRSWLRHPSVAKTERVLGRPATAWFSAIVVMTLWHLPALYNQALAHEWVHIIQHLSFLITGVMFWWPVLNPIPEMRLTTGMAVLYLFAAAAENTVLGIILTFMRVGHYPTYLHPEDEYGALGLIRNGWGVTPQIDQRLGGLLMWVPGCSMYFIAILGVISHWYAEPDTEDDPVLDAHMGRRAQP